MRAVLYRFDTGVQYRQFKLSKFIVNSLAVLGWITFAVILSKPEWLIQLIWSMP